MYYVCYNQNFRNFDFLQQYDVLINVFINTFYKYSIKIKLQLRILNKLV